MNIQSKALYFVRLLVGLCNSAYVYVKLLHARKRNSLRPRANTSSRQAECAGDFRRTGRYQTGRTSRLQDLHRARLVSSDLFTNACQPPRHYNTSLFTDYFPRMSQKICYVYWIKLSIHVFSSIQITVRINKLTFFNPPFQVIKWSVSKSDETKLNYSYHAVTS